MGNGWTAIMATRGRGRFLVKGIDRDDARTGTLDGAG